MAVLALPQELLERIIDFLHADRATLCACALAHSTMRAPSQRHLFYQLSLSHGNASARRFGVLLRASSALAAAVQELRLFWTTPGGVHDVLGVTLPALHTLRLDHCWMHQLRATPGFESTRRLVISDAQFEDVGQIVALLGTLPRLSALKFSDSHPGSSVTVVANGRLLSPPSFALTYLDLRGIKQPEIVNHLARWLCAPGSRALTRLETLGTNANQYGDTVTVAPKLLLETVAPTLQELRVVQYHAGLRLADADLPPLPVLERFVMDTFDKTTPGPTLAADAAFMHALCACAPTLADVRFLAIVNGLESNLWVTHICWSSTLEFVARCRRAAGPGAHHLRTVTVSFQVITFDEPDLQAALVVAERDALAVLHPSADEMCALPRTPRLFLHAHYTPEGGNNFPVGPVREILHGVVD